MSTTKVTETLDINHKQDITWYLGFDGSINKLGAGAGVWIHNTHNNHAEGHAYRLNSNALITWQSMRLSS